MYEPPRDYMETTEELYINHQGTICKPSRDYMQVFMAYGSKSRVTPGS